MLNLEQDNVCISDEEWVRYMNQILDLDGGQRRLKVLFKSVFSRSRHNIKMIFKPAVLKWFRKNFPYEEYRSVAQCFVVHGAKCHYTFGKLILQDLQAWKDYFGEMGLQDMKAILTNISKHYECLDMFCELIESEGSVVHVIYNGDQNGLTALKASLNKTRENWAWASSPL